MPVPTATGCISELEESLSDMLASLAAFQTWVGVATTALARERIYGAVVPDLRINDHGEITEQSIKDLRPFAQVYMPDGGLDREKNSSSASTQTGSTQRMLEIYFEQGLDEKELDTLPASERTFKNNIGAIYSALFAACNTQPDIRKLTLTVAPQCNARDEAAQEGEDIMFAKFTAVFGSLA